MIDEPYDPTANRVVRMSLAAGLALRGLPLDKPSRLKLAGTELMKLIDPKSPSRGPELRLAQPIEATDESQDVAQLLKQLETLPTPDDFDVGDGDEEMSPDEAALNQSISDEVGQVGVDLCPGHTQASHAGS